MADAAILYGKQENTHVLRFVGEVRYMLAPAVTRLLQRLFATDPLPEDFLVDLSAATVIDSTCLGVLAQIANAMAEHGRPRVTLLADSADILTTLLSVGFEDEFDIVQEDRLIGAEAQPLPTETVDRSTLNRTVLEAHRCLMALSETNAEVFRDVVSLLEKDLD